MGLESATATETALQSSKTTNPLSIDTVKKAVSALRQWKSKKSEGETPKLFPSDEFLYLILTTNRIPPKSRTNAYKIPLPHPLHSPSVDSSEFCLFIDDRDGRLTSKGAKEKIDVEGIPISKVIKLSKLRTDYKGFEAKRKLLGSFDMFFADKRVIPFLPKLLGKHFYKKKKIPVPVELGRKNWKEQIERVCGSALVFFGTGTCVVVKVAKESMEVEEIVENVVAAVDRLVEFVPQKWENIRSLHLKLSESLSLPVYESIPEMNLTISALVEKEGNGIVDDTGYAEEKREERKNKEKESKGNVKGGKAANGVHGSSLKKSKKTLKRGRIHEIHYMDNIDGELAGSELSNEIEMNTPVEDEKKNIRRSKGDEKPRKVSKVVSVDDGGDELAGAEIQRDTGVEDGKKKKRKSKGDEKPEKVLKGVDESSSKKIRKSKGDEKPRKVSKAVSVVDGGDELAGAELSSEIQRDTGVEDGKKKKRKNKGDEKPEKVLKGVDESSSKKIRKSKGDDKPRKVAKAVSVNDGGDELAAAELSSEIQRDTGVEDGSKRKRKSKGDEKPENVLKGVDESSSKKSKKALKRGRIHEVKCMDDGVGELTGPELSSEFEKGTLFENEKTKKSKKPSKERTACKFEHMGAGVDQSVDAELNCSAEQNTSLSGEGEKIENDDFETSKIMGKKRKKNKNQTKMQAKEQLTNKSTLFENEKAKTSKKPSKKGTAHKFEHMDAGVDEYVDAELNCSAEQNASLSGEGEKIENKDFETSKIMGKKRKSKNQTKEQAKAKKEKNKA